MNKHASEGDFAELALAVYVEELVTHKRVLYVGDPSSPAPERLAATARSVEVVSTRSRVRGTRRGGRVASRRWPGPEDEARWDVVVVPDLAGAGLGEKAKVAELARWVGRGGVVVAGTPERQASGGPSLAYEELFDLLDGTFEHVRMLGQAPFAGFSVVDFAPLGELEVTFDGSILEGAGEGAQRYFALCGDRDVVLDAYAVVQVPSTALAEAEERSREAQRASELADRLREQQDALDAVNVHAEEIERELEVARAALEQTRRERGRAQEQARGVEKDRSALEGRLRELERELEALSRAHDVGEEYVALEAALHERGREIVELRQEVERRGTLVRDLVEQLRELELARGAVSALAPTAPPPALDPDAAARVSLLHAQLDHALGRAMDAEAQKSELTFRLDEVRGELAMSERRFEQDLEEMRRLEAALRGTVRGLNARLGEVIELHQLTQARLALAEDDRAAGEARSRRLVRELAEAREQVELEIARNRAAEAAWADDRPEEEPPRESSGAREAELLDALGQARDRAAQLEGWQARARSELAEARAALQQLDERVQTMRASYEARVAELVDELHRASAQAEEALGQAGELRARAEVRDSEEASLRGELEGLRLRLADREAALSASRSSARRGPDEPPLEVPESVASVPGEASFAPPLEVPSAPDSSGELEEARRAIDALRAELEALGEARREAEAALLTERAERDAERHRLDQLSRELEAARAAVPEVVPDPAQEARIVELSAWVEARDALVSRVQGELVEAAGRQAVLEERLAECTGQLTRAREDFETARASAAVDAEETHRELDETRERLDQSELERDRALAALGDARAILQQLMEELPARRDGGAPSVGEGAVTRQLRERIGQLDAEAADREAQIRSLSARLEEREDRLRALERDRDAGEPADDSVALQERVLELEERLARLQEELEHERSRRRLDHPS